MQFNYDPAEEVLFQGFLKKANIGVFERWQKRYFRIVGRCLYYFKKEDGPEPCGFIPLIDIKVEEIPSRKGQNFPFSVNLVKNPQLAKRSEYLLSAETEESRAKWIQAINDNAARTIFKLPYEEACCIYPKSRSGKLLMPYFLPEIFQTMDHTGYKTRGIWTLDVPSELVGNIVNTINMNYHVPTDDIHTTLAAVIEYFKELPEALLPPQALQAFAQKVTPEKIREFILQAPAPHRQLIRAIGLHFKKVLDNTAQNNVSQYALQPIIGNLLVRSGPGVMMPPPQVRDIQDKVAAVFLQNAPTILEDVHQFMEALRLPVIKKCRLTPIITMESSDILEGAKGLLVSVVREDKTGWCTVYTTNRRVGLVHSAFMRELTPEELKELETGPNVDALYDAVREKMPEMVLLFDAMTEEASMLKELLQV